ncbi:hypothetical protein GWI33_002119 [Rhynchophorus ferrugineus]|uniref:Uncharacterized protein n=1 Tax=Rhynchophorus ferrugineus TaxID=354439 RepID=A0A834IS29_RHYFE|nr:hypothetical protein GWI33_002119 [Rhynchophorus ferrugineus]
MTSGMPELGSKISLISKADIRYEGRLFTVDPQECTIALASVRSFGTENREAQFPVPAQNQVYDYILFRGSDIKDISIVNSVPHTQPLNDPAIMQLSVPPSLGPQQFQQHPILGHMTHAPYSTFMPMGGLAGSGTSGLPATGMNRAGLAPGSKPNLIGGGAAASRSTTPASVGSRKSVSVDQGTQAGGSQQRDGNKQVKPIQPPKGQQNRNKSRDRKNSQNRADNHDHRSQQYIQQNRGRQQHQNNQQGYQQRGGWNNQRNMTRGRGRSRGGPFRSGGQSGQIGANKKNTLKFDKDYDFEQANTAFEELKNKLAKVKLEEAAGTSKNEVNGSGVEPDKKDDSGNETGAGETEQDEEHEVFYDKNKSFFDKISCEAVERAKGKMQRTDWRKERKLNSETFGVAATRRGSYRGRAGFRGGYRGSFRGNYRQPNQQQRRNSEPQNSQQNQQGSKSTRPVYCPLSNEEALAKIKQDEGSKLQQGQENSVIIDDIEKVTHDLAVTDESETLISDPKTDLILKEKINVIDEKSTVLDEKDIKETEKIVVDDPPACVGQ